MVRERQRSTTPQRASLLVGKGQNGEGFFADVRRRWILWEGKVRGRSSDGGEGWRWMASPLSEASRQSSARGRSINPGASVQNDRHARGGLIGFPRRVSLPPLLPIFQIRAPQNLKT
jgi:hypothetical protein